MSGHAAALSSPTRDARTPVMVIAGFLGSGKTTLLARAVADPALSNSLLIVNEFGDIGIDHHLLERADDRTLLLGNGCMCCQLRGDLQETLVDVSMRRRRGEIAGFDRVFIEMSGLADPGPVAQTLYKDVPIARDYRLAHVVTLVDACNEQGRRASLEIATRQVAAADLIIVSKPDRASAEDIERTRAWAASINRYARFEVSAHGSLDLVPLANSQPGTGEAPPAPDEEEASYLGRYASPHAAGISSFSMQFPEPLKRGVFEEFIDVLVRLRGADLLRVKGFIRFDDDPGTPVLIQGVCHAFDRYARAGKQATTPEVSTLVFIVRALSRTDVESLWKSLSSLSR